jgi:hypothetical protein
MTELPPPPEEPPMEIHKPKPIHNWREFLKEVGTIVLGVSIALGAEQTVEWFHWHAQVKEAREVIATELAFNLAGAVTRMRTQSCAERRLDELALILDVAAKNGSLPPIGDIHRPPRGIWPTGSWESVVASQTASHFPRQQLADIAAAYKFVQRIENYAAAELGEWAELYTMVGPGRRLDPASESELRKALSEARSMSRTTSSLGLQLGTRVKTLGLPFSPDDLNRIANAKRPPASAAPADICLPLGSPPASYGQGARSAFAGDDVNQFPDFGPQ